MDTLLRKPGGFRDYRYQQALFPQPVFRQAWERLEQWYVQRTADLMYLRVVAIDTVGNSQGLRQGFCDRQKDSVMLLAQF